MARCAVYCRVSSDEQAEKGTIESQVEYAKKYLELHGPENDITEVEYYLDEGVSGTIALENRPAASRMINDAKAGRFKILFVYRLDRLARSVKHILNTNDLLEEKNVALKSMTEAFDTGTPTGKFFMTLLASIAALERETILERTQGGKKRNAKIGHWVSGSPPFGYHIGEDKSLIIFEPEAEIVRLVFKLYQEGMTTVDVAKYLNAKDKPTPAMSKGHKGKSSGKWHAGHVSIILKTEAYTGIYHYLKRSKKAKETIEMETPVIIDRELFNEAQNKIFENSDNARRARGRFYLLRGLIFCGHCGRAMVGNSGHSKNGRVYYRCTGTVDQGQGKRCTAKLIRAVDIENSVWEDIVEVFEHPEKFEKYINKHLEENKENEPQINEELAEVERTIQLKQKARGKILAMISKDIISESEAESELRNLAAEISALNERREFLFEKQNFAKEQETEILNAKIVIDTVKPYLNTLSDEDKARIIRGFVRRIEVFTITKENGKKGNMATAQYTIRGMGLRNSGDVQLHTTLYTLESTWIYQAFSRTGGIRLRWK